MAWTPESLRRLRLELGWSQSELARRLGMDLNRWAAVENGEVNLDAESEVMLEKLSQHLRDYSKSLKFYSKSDSLLKENKLNQITQFDLESIDD